MFDVVIDNELCIAQKKTQQALCFGKLHCILKVERQQIFKHMLGTNDEVGLSFKNVNLS